MASEALTQVNDVLHYRTQTMQPYGSESRKCSECGVRLWIPSDGVWTDDHSVWQNPPPGYVNCKHTTKEEVP